MRRVEEKTYRYCTVSHCTLQLFNDTKKNFNDTKKTHTGSNDEKKLAVENLIGLSL